MSKTKAVASVPNYELLKDAYAIIDGIPKHIINLDIIGSHGMSLSCGTICCAAGWLGHHPRFQEMGLQTVGNGLRWKGKWANYDEAMGEVFNIPGEVAENLFGGAGYSSLDSYRPASVPIGAHKEMFLNRIRTFLQREGQL